MGKSLGCTTESTLDLPATAFSLSFLFWLATNETV